MDFKDNFVKERYENLPYIVALLHESQVGKDTTIIEVFSHDPKGYSILSESMEDERKYTRLLRFIKLRAKWKVLERYERI